MIIRRGKAVFTGFALSVAFLCMQEVDYMDTIITNIQEKEKQYRPIPFWSWNDELDPKVLGEQIEWMHDNKIGGFFMHARGGLKTPYLGEKWMECIESCCKSAEKLDMDAWVYDENGWPSGFAGGKLLEKMENRDMYVKCSIGACDASADVNYRLDGERLIRIQNKEVQEADTGEGENRLAQSCVNLYIFPSASTVDILNPGVVDQFIHLTHDYYKDYFGDDFAGRVKGFFTDEPQYYRWDTPYSPMMESYFKENYNQDILDQLGLLFVEKEGYREFRYRYWLGMQKLMLQNFAKKLYSWCDDNHVQLTGHYVEEVTMGFQMMCCAGVMPFYEYEHIPGIDWLGRDTLSELSPRQLGSAARQLGKKQILTETFGCCGWDVSPAELCRIAGFQYACGVNLMCHHLIPYSEHGQRKRDYPAHFNAINPWVKEKFKDFNGYFARLGALLGESEEPVNVAMLHPMRSAYFDYKRSEEAQGFGIKELDHKLHEACRVLSARGISYHFLDETLLERHGFVDGKTIGCGKCSYTYLVIPRMLTMGVHTEKLLNHFVSNGGKVLLLDEKPEYLEGAAYSYDYLESNCSLEEIVEAQDFSVGCADTDIYCAYRKFDGKPFLFLQNGSGEKCYTQSFCFKEGYRSFVSLDLLTMETKSLPLTVNIPENGSLLVFPTYEEWNVSGAVQEKVEMELVFQDADVKFETNFMTLDMVRYSKDGMHYSEPLLRNRLFRLLLEERYEGRLWIKYNFEIETVPQQLSILAEKGGALEYKVNGRPFAFSHPYEEEPTLWIADIALLVHEGWNSYEVAMDWHQSEETYHALFGENVTESLRNCIVYDSEIEDVYLAGKFGVYSHGEVETYDEETVCAHDFYIGKVPRRVKDLIAEGLPFFRGKMTMKTTIRLHNRDTILCVKGRYLTARVYVNGKEAGELFFQHRIDISPYAVEGDNLIEVEFLIGNRNLLGPFHHAGSEDFVSPYLFESFSLPDSKEGNCRYRLARFYV